MQGRAGIDPDPDPDFDFDFDGSDGSATIAWNRLLQFRRNGRAYDDLLLALNLLGVLGVLAVHLMGSAIAG